MTKAKKLRQLLQGSEIIMAPGAYDAWSARLIEKAGFPVVYMTGYGVSASVLGRPDPGHQPHHPLAQNAGIRHGRSPSMNTIAPSGAFNRRTGQFYRIITALHPSWQ